MVDSAINAIATPAQEQSSAEKLVQRRPAAPDRIKPPQQIKDAAVQFEAVMMSQMLSHMFTDLDPHGPFGGGKGEEIFNSFLIEEYGKVIAESGNTGISDKVAQQMISNQMKQVGRSRRVPLSEQMKEQLLKSQEIKPSDNQTESVK